MIPATTLPATTGVVPVPPATTDIAPATTVVAATPAIARAVPPRRRPAGFTILEAVLTLALAVVLMGLIGSTLQFYARNLNVRDMDVRRVQLAAAVMQMITDDLRAAVYAPEFDSSVLEQFLAGAADDAVGTALGAEASAALGLDDGSSLLDSPTLGSSQASDGAEAGSTTDLVTSTMTLRRPGIIGNQSELQFEISRLPRWEQWQPMLDDDPTTADVQDVPSDMKTVTYYVQPAGTVGGVPDPLRGFLPEQLTNGDEPPGGLVRRELDRAANRWAMEHGGAATLMGTGELIASEVLAIEFSYYDGVNWQIVWNSDERQALPLAIEVKITIGDPISGDPFAANQLSDGESSPTTAQPRVFTQVIQLPAGRVIDNLQSTTGGYQF